MFLWVPLFPLSESDSDPNLEMDSCTMQKCSIRSDLDSVIEMYVIGTEVCPWHRDPSLKWVHYPFGKGILF